jgi:hypothetical protein
MDWVSELLREIEAIYARERRDGVLEHGALRQAYAFSAARKVVAAEDPDGFFDMPPWIVAEVYVWLGALETEGSVVFIFSGGEADHTPVFQSLHRLLPSRSSLGPGLDLRAGESSIPSKHAHAYFTCYTSATGDDMVFHGLHREYAETGTLTETEYRHGVQVGKQRFFDQQGEEVETLER